MDLRQLRYLVRTIESSSISQAAAALNIAQPSLSQSLKELERELGVMLLHRAPNGILPTETGMMVADRARAILRLVDTLKQDAISAGATIMGDVRVGMPTTMALHLTVPLVQMVHRDFPGVRLRVSEGMSGHVQEWVLSGRLDIAVLYTAGPVAGLHLDEVAQESLCLISRYNAREAGKPVAFETLAAYPLALPGPDHGLRRTIEASWRGSLQPLDVAVEVDSLPHLKHLASDGRLHTILPAAACAQEVQMQTLMARPIAGPPLRRPIVLATSVNRPLSVASTHIRALVRTMILQALARTSQTEAGERPARR
ncbi:MAG: LysR substrate-binding domain-containing protein [Beijerinckiaceae bacterium]